MPRFLTLLITAACLGSSAFAQNSGDVAQGRAMAQENCSQCHEIGPGGAFKLYPPSFASIAAYMRPDTIRTRIMYPDHYSIMPQFHSRMHVSALDDLVAYIQSLED